MEEGFSPDEFTEEEKELLQELSKGQLQISSETPSLEKKQECRTNDMVGVPGAPSGALGAASVSVRPEQGLSSGVVDPEDPACDIDLSGSSEEEGDDLDMEDVEDPA